MPYIQPSLTKYGEQGAESDISGVDIYALNTPVSQFCPPGSVLAYAGAMAPSGFLPCNGASVAIEDYPLLYKAIGTAFGPATSTTFSVPNLQGRAIRMVTGPYALGTSGGSDAVTLVSDNLPAHTHPVAVTDPGHIHGIHDPGHSHGLTNNSQNAASGNSFSTCQTYFAGVSGNTGTATTGVTVTSAATGISAAATANVTSNKAVDIRNPYLVLNYIIKF